MTWKLSLRFHVYSSSIALFHVGREKPHVDIFLEVLGFLCLSNLYTRCLRRQWERFVKYARDGPPYRWIPDPSIYVIIGWDADKKRHRRAWIDMLMRRQAGWCQIGLRKVCCLVSGLVEGVEIGLVFTLWGLVGDGLCFVVTIVCFLSKTKAKSIAWSMF